MLCNCFHSSTGEMEGEKKLKMISEISSLGSSDGKAFTCNVEDLGSIPGFGRSSEEGNGNPLLKNSMGRRAWKSDPIEQLTLS